MGVNPLVLSLFPGIGLLDMAFDEEGFCVVRGPDGLVFEITKRTRSTIYFWVPNYDTHRYGRWYEAAEFYQAVRTRHIVRAWSEGQQP
jgi:DNA (cytosine-5)-methyltransferase 1